MLVLSLGSISSLDLGPTPPIHETPSRLEFLNPILCASFDWSLLSEWRRLQSLFNMPNYQESFCDTGNSVCRQFFTILSIPSLTLLMWDIQFKRQFNTNSVSDVRLRHPAFNNLVCCPVITGISGVYGHFAPFRHWHIKTIKRSLLLGGHIIKIRRQNPSHHISSKPKAQTKHPHHGARNIRHLVCPSGDCAGDFWLWCQGSS